MNKATYVIFFGLTALSALATAQTTDVKNADHQKLILADDGSWIKNMSSIGAVQTVLCILGPQNAIQASRHKTVSQIWYVTNGQGQAWLSDSGGHESLIDLKPGVSFAVPLGYSFQFRNTGNVDLNIFIVNTTPWTGDGELIPVENHWRPRF